MYVDWYAGFARRLVQGNDVVLSVEVSCVMLLL